MAEIGVLDAVSSSSIVGAFSANVANKGAENLSQYAAGDAIGQAAAQTVQPFRFANGVNVAQGAVVSYNNGLGVDSVVEIYIETGAQGGKAVLFDVADSYGASICGTCGDIDDQTAPPTIYLNGDPICGKRQFQSWEQKICSRPLILTGATQEVYTIVNGVEVPSRSAVNFRRHEVINNSGLYGDLLFSRQKTGSTLVEPNFFGLTLNSTNHRLDENSAWQSAMIPPNTRIKLTLTIAGTPRPY